MTAKWRGTAHGEGITTGIQICFRRDMRVFPAARKKPFVRSLNGGNWRAWQGRMTRQGSGHPSEAVSRAEKTGDRFREVLVNEREVAAAVTI